MLSTVGGASVVDFTDCNGTEGVRINLTPGAPLSLRRAQRTQRPTAGKLRHVLSVQFTNRLGHSFHVTKASLMTVRAMRQVSSPL